MWYLGAWVCLVVWDQWVSFSDNLYPVDVTSGTWVRQYPRDRPSGLYESLWFLPSFVKFERMRMFFNKKTTCINYLFIEEKVINKVFLDKTFFLRASVSYFDKIPNLIAGMLSRVVRNYHKLLSHVLRACESKRIWTPEVEDLRLLLWHSHYLAGLQAAHVDSRLGFLCADALVVGWECCHGTSSCVCLFSACYNGVITGTVCIWKNIFDPPPPPPPPPPIWIFGWTIH